MKFGDAIDALNKNLRVSRYGWNGIGMWLELMLPGENNKMTLPYIFMHTIQNDTVPWVASQTDILATDWFIVT